MPPTDDDGYGEEHPPSLPLTTRALIGAFQLYSTVSDYAPTVLKYTWVPFVAAIGMTNCIWNDSSASMLSSPRHTLENSIHIDVH